MATLYFRLLFPERWSPEFVRFIAGFLEVNPAARIASLKGTKKMDLF